MPTTVLQLKENLRGKDFIIGDVHGSDAFTAVINRLKPEDRLFIVGDLFDRGSKNIEVFNLIKKHQHQIYVSKGNHEQMLLDAMAEMDSMNTTKKTADNSQLFFANGGKWIAKSKQVHMGNFHTCEKIDEIHEIRAYVETLPYAIRVGNGKNAFIVCHANMPVDDERLSEMITQDLDFSPPEKKNMIWARENEFFSKRTPMSDLVYCGHNSIESLKEAEQAVRKTQNHINLDVGACYCSAFVLVNHTDKIAEIIDAEIIKAEVDEDSSPDEELELQREILSSIASKVNEHILDTLDKCKSAQALDTWFKRRVEGFPAYEQPKVYLNMMKHAIENNSIEWTQEMKSDLISLIESPTETHLLTLVARADMSAIELLCPKDEGIEEAKQNLHN